MYCASPGELMDDDHSGNIILPLICVSFTSCDVCSTVSYTPIFTLFDRTCFKLGKWVSHGLPVCCP